MIRNRCAPAEFGRVSQIQPWMALARLEGPSEALNLYHQGSEFSMTPTSGAFTFPYLAGHSQGSLWWILLGFRFSCWPPYFPAAYSHGVFCVLLKGHLGWPHVCWVEILLIHLQHTYSSSFFGCLSARPFWEAGFTPRFRLRLSALRCLLGCGEWHPAKAQLPRVFWQTSGIVAALKRPQKEVEVDAFGWQVLWENGMKSHAFRMFQGCLWGGRSWISMKFCWDSLGLSSVPTSRWVKLKPS